jgi:hypothetical protein
MIIHLFRILTHANFYAADKLIALTENHISTANTNPKLPNTSRVVICVCTGKSETEMHSPSSDLCLCLDTDRRSLYASSFAYKYLLRNKAKMIFHHFNYGNGLLALIKSISSKVQLPISVLFQHPSPSPSSGMDLSKAISDCIKALHLELITECIFVYDCHLSKSIGKWNNQRIQSIGVGASSLSAVGSDIAIG